MERIIYSSLLAKLVVIFTAVAGILCLTPALTHAQTSAFAGAEIVILNQDTPFHYEPASEGVRFVVARGTLAEVQYFADPEVRNGQIWRKLRVADGHYGYVRESLISKFTGTIPTIWREIDYQPSKVHLNYEARKQNFDIVINQGVVYINPNTDSLESNDTTQPQPQPQPEEEDEVVEEEEEDVAEEEDEDTSPFKGSEIVITSKNASFHESPAGNQKFVVAKGTITEILFFSEPQTVRGKVWHKVRVADGNWGYVTEDSIAKFTGTVPSIFREFNYQPSKVHLNYEARKVNPNVVINQGVNYVTAPDSTTEEEKDVVEEDETDEETVDSELNQKLMLQIIELLKQLINLRMQLMQR